MHADLEGQRAATREHLPHREQHPLVVLSRRDRRARRQQQLAAVGVDVRAEQADVVSRGGRGGSRDQVVESPYHRIRALLGEERVEAAEA